MACFTLGHAKLETTAIHTQVAIRQLKAVYEATHPGLHEPDDAPGSLDV
jgi:integrase/recombinase XerD